MRARYEVVVQGAVKAPVVLLKEVWLLLLLL